MKKDTSRSILLIVVFLTVNFIHAFSAGPPAHVVVPPGTCMLVGTQAPYNSLHGGDTLLMTTGNKAYIYLKDFTGYSYAPIVVINSGGPVTIGTNYTYGVKIGGCRYMKFTGTGTSDPYGFSVTQTNGDGVTVGDLSSDIEVNHVHINNCGIRGIVAKTDPACGGYAYRSNFTQYNTIIHDNLIENTTTEGMYIGSSFYSGETMNCSGVDSLILPSILNGCQIFNNIVRHTGYDGIQAASALNLSVHDNLVQYDSQSGVSSQMSGILIGGGSQGDCYNNYIENGKGDGIENLGLGGYKIYNNVVVSPGFNFYPGNQSYPKFGIYTNDCSATQGSEFDLMFNTIISPKTSGIKFASNNATASVIENNAIINPGQSGSYIVNNGYSGIIIRNNYTSATIGPAMFMDTTYKTNPGSPLIDAGYPETRGIATDKFTNPRSQCVAPDCGVYEATSTVALPTVTTAAVINITQTTATSGGNVTSAGGANVTARGVCWSTSQSPVVTGNHTCDGTGTGSFVSNITGLTPGTLYYVRAYATNSGGTAYGNQLSFTTLTAVTLPTLTTTSATNITQTTATSGGNVTSDGGATVTARGVCWSTTTSPVITGNHTSDGTGTGTFVSNITGLTAGTLYYVRAYATNSAGTSYGNQVSFTTLTAVIIPTVTTAAVTNITQTTATSGGNVTSDGGATVTARGVCWSTSAGPVATGNHTTDGTGTGSFVSNITGLTAGTLYHIRAYATNSAGTSYGNELTFTTLTVVTVPTLTTTAVTNLTQTTATSGGNVTSDGGATVTVRGVCWSTSTGPVATGNHTCDGTGTGSFVSSITGLTASTLYYVRAYATNSAGTSYGNELTFTTLAAVTAPTLTTTAVTNITQTTATGGGNVTSDGGATVTARGVCWGTSTGPVVTGNHTNDGTGTGSFVSNITGLTAGTLYYTRAYATNSAGTSYGNEVTFTTLTVLTAPTVNTTAVTNITQTSATGGGNVTSDGGATVTARGVCWGTSSGPVVTGNHTNDGSGTGSFVSNITGLTGGTLYYVRAYATNSVGTSYGNELTFTTLTLPSVITAAITDITQTTATGGGNVISEGGATVTARGVCWSTVQLPTISCNHTTDGVGSGSYVSSITGLTANTVYYVRAYATNCVGTSYGVQQSFTTLPVSSLPTVRTDPVTDIHNSTATSGGNVVNDGGAAVTVRGVCWNTTPNPTISNSHTEDGSGTGAFISYLTNLRSRTKYFVRAYATNSNGTSYGNQQGFITAKFPYTDDSTDLVVPGSETSTLKLYPNPVKSNLTIEFELTESSNVNLSVFNLSGVKIYNEEMVDQPVGLRQVQFNASSFPEGMYIVLLTHNTWVLRKSFIKVD